MKATELPVLSSRLNELAEYYDKRPPAAAALRVWLDVLAECPLHDVQAVLTDWPKAHRAMPLADEVLKLCRSRLSDRIEADAARNLATAPSIRQAIAGLRQNPTPEAAHARQELVAMVRSLGSIGKDPKGWARRLRDREQAGEMLGEAQHKAWKAALRFEPTEAAPHA